jgi:hypothetical protein
VTVQLRGLHHLHETHLVAKDQVPMVHSGASNWSLKEEVEAALNNPVNAGGHVNPNALNKETTCRKSTPMPSADRFTPKRRASTNRNMMAADKPQAASHKQDGRAGHQRQHWAR